MAGLALVALLAGCSSSPPATGGAQASAQGATAAKSGSKEAVAAVVPGLPAQPVATVPSNVKDVSLEIYEVRRAAGAATVAFALDNKGTEALAVNYRLSSSASLTVESVSLVDVANLKRYLTLKDTQGGCVCSASENIEAGKRAFFYATFTAPPADVTSIVVETPMGSVLGIPITDV